MQCKVWRHTVATEKVCKDKELTRRLLEFEDVPVPRGMAFEAEDRDIADAVRPRLGHSVVVKPSNAGGSHGVTVGVTNRGVFREAWDRAASVRTPGRKIVVEEQLPGIEVRCYVVGEQVVSAILRIQPYVVGDGESTISQLIEKTIEYRSRNAWYDRARPTPDLSFLKSQDIEHDEVPEQGKIIILNPFHLFRLGNYTVEVLEDLSPLIKDSAVRAVASIPNLEIAAVDFLTEDFRNSHGKVIEMNTAPALTQHLYPAFGEPKDVIGSIVEHFVRQSR